MRSHGGVRSYLAGERPASASFEHSIREHLDHLLHSPQFDASGRSRDFLRFVVNETLEGRGEALDQRSIAVAVFGRKGAFDSVSDPIVRVQAGRLRRSLERYYLVTHEPDTMRIELPKGGYAPEFVAPANGKHGDGVVRAVPVAASTPVQATILVRDPEMLAAENTRVAAHLQSEIAIELCRYGDVHVVCEGELRERDPGQTANARFELRSALRRQAEDFHISAWLVDRATGRQLWSDEYRAKPEPEQWSGGIDEVARVIAGRVGAENGVIARLLASEFGAGRPHAPEKTNAIHSCYHFFFSRQVIDLRATIEAVQSLAVREPEMPIAWAYLARLYLANYSFELTDLDTPIESAIGFANQAVLLDPGSARARCVLAAALLVKDEVQAARNELERTQHFNSGSLAYREIVGWLTTLAGDWDRGTAMMREAMERNPYCLPHVKHGFWADHLRRGNFEQAYIAALEYRDASFFWHELMITCCLGHLGRLTEARRSGTELLKSRPGFPSRGRTLIGYYIKNPDLRERVFEGLRKAGVHLDA